MVFYRFFIKNKIKVNKLLKYIKSEPRNNWSHVVSIVNIIKILIKLIKLSLTSLYIFKNINKQTMTC